MNHIINGEVENQDSHMVAPLVSVIVPIYNSALYLEDCLHSLLNQTLNNIEYIFIDDCSTDSSLGILRRVLENYPKRSAYVRIIEHMTNKGVAVSRSEGVKAASGKWIIHCDSDDIIELNAYEKLVKAGESNCADIVGCNFHVFGNKIRGYTAKEPIGLIDSKLVMSSIGGSNKSKIMGSLWNKLINRDLWKNVEIPDGLSYCEDIAALFQILQKNPKIYYIEDALYYYRIHPTSLISTKDNRMLKQCEVFIPFLESLKLGADECWKTSINARIIDLLYRLLKSECLSMSDFSSRYKEYISVIRDNKQHNLLELFHLRLSLMDMGFLAVAIGFCNATGYRLVKGLRNRIVR